MELVLESSILELESTNFRKANLTRYTIYAEIKRSDWMLHVRLRPIGVLYSSIVQLDMLIFLFYFSFESWILDGNFISMAC